MWTDAVDLRDFYKSPLGAVARRMIGRRIHALWPDVHGQSVLGVGYALPYLSILKADAIRVAAAMPAAQGVIAWPADGAGLTMLIDETDLPLADCSIDRVLLVHALECAERTRPMMRELWRVLADGGRMIVVAPNRHGLWALFETTPFGHGRPYTAAQLSRGLRDAMFTPHQATPALFVPPVRSRVLLSSATAWERLGERWFSSFAGVVVFEATKQIHAIRLTAAAERAPAYAAVPAR
jgi:SAM-dependent methyltransferase